jgi:glutamate-1-semialdehyde 2,1-aminomutase
MAAARGTLEHVLTEEAFARMCDLGAKMLDGMQGVIDRHALPWVVAGLGARAEFRFCTDMPRNGTESHDAHDEDVEVRACT